MNAANIQLIANVGEILAAILVVVSLVYVALQIRQNTHALQVTAAQSYVSMYNTITSEISRPDMAAVWHQGLEDFASLDAADLVRFSALAGQMMRVMESAYLQWRQGAVEDQLWHASETALQDTMAMAGFQQWWQYRSRWYSEDFQSLVNTFDVSGDRQPPYPDQKYAEE